MKWAKKSTVFFANFIVKACERFEAYRVAMATIGQHMLSSNIIKAFWLQKVDVVASAKTLKTPSLSKCLREARHNS